ncbi:carbohydrate binding family 9 domain-containing protein [Xanthocytophaga agilis]|uniref:DUF5916 domain-containing protein n=1 Tax=Xanthocytophaga agilis TaxID=3048010 RepID=A0AAE3UHR2_9BACT|nr:DUF5916 domain-containing protein [Xanthocytophaga agilis]MDJ1503762.1 DUF5916 domain-containing protein [Xanthocytophaga agilis]
MHTTTYLLTLLLIGFTGVLYAQDTTYFSKPPLEIQKLEGSIILDGLSDEAAWQTIPPFPFVVFEPVWGTSPTEKTELLITHDNQFVYVAGRCYTKDSSTIVARTLTRDGWRGDDWVTIQFDSRFDHQNALVFSIYPLGSRYDMAVSNDAIELGSSTFNSAYNMIWEAKTVINKEGWFFELKIPLYNLRFREGANGEVKMAISATRAIQYIQEYHQFPAISRNVIDAITKPSVKQPVLFKDLPHPSLFLLTPYIATSTSRQQLWHENKNNFIPDRKNTIQLGLDAKIGVSPYLTLDATINPDFAQAEADIQQVNLSRFSLFFPERRLFFQEQAGLFEFNLGDASQLFYSRRIGIDDGKLTQIYGGLRLTGKLGTRTDIGLLTMQSTSSSSEAANTSATENFGVFRLRHKVVNDRSFAGMMFTSRISAKEQNYTYGADALLNIVKNQYLLFSLANTVTYTSGKSKANAIGQSRLSVLWENRKRTGWIHRLNYIFSGKDFNPEVGFVDRTNFHAIAGALHFGKFSKGRKGLFQYQRWTLAQGNSYWNAQTGKLESLTAGMSWNANTFLGTSWNVSVVTYYEYLTDTLEFGKKVVIVPGRYNFSSASLLILPPLAHKIRLPVGIGEGSFYGGRKFFFSFSPIFSMGKHLEIQTGYDLTYLRFPDKDLYNTIHIGRLKVSYALDLHFSASLNIQYNSNEQKFFTNARFRYNFGDGHDLYLVWNENLLSNRQVEGRIHPLSDQQTILLKYFFTFQPRRLYKKHSGHKSS